MIYKVRVTSTYTLILTLSLVDMRLGVFPNTPPHIQHYWAWYVDNTTSDPFNGSRIDSGLQSGFILNSTQQNQLNGWGLPPFILYFDHISNRCETWSFFPIWTLWNQHDNFFIIRMEPLKIYYGAKWNWFLICSYLVLQLFFFN